MKTATGGRFREPKVRWKIPGFLQRRWALLLVLASALSLRIFIFLNVTPVLQTDSVGYFFLQESEPVRTPGYYFFMEAVHFFNDLFAITSQYLRLIIFFQLFLLGMINSVLIFTLAKKISLSEGFALAMGLLYNLDLFVVGFEFVVLTETLTLTLLGLTMLFYGKIFEGVRTAPYWAGLASFALLLTRPTYTWLFLILVALTLLFRWRQFVKGFFRQSYARPLLIFLLINLIGIGGWSLRNKRRFDFFGISTILPYQLSYYTWNFVEKYRPGSDEELNEYARILQEVNGQPYDFRWRLREDRQMSEAEISKVLLKLNRKLIEDNFREYARLVPGAAAYYYDYSWYWLRQRQRSFLGKSKLVSAPFRFFRDFYARLFQNPYSLIFLVAVIPAVFIISRRKGGEAAHLALLFEGVIHYNFLVSVILTNAGVNNLRFRVPVEPFILLVFYAAVFHFVRQLRKPRRKPKKDVNSPEKA